jgi:hypothetical protein
MEDNCSNHYKDNTCKYVLTILLDSFIARMKEKTNSGKKKLLIEDALEAIDHRTDRDKCIIKAYYYLKKNKPEQNPFIKYISHYHETGKKLSTEFFPYDPIILEKYYTKADKQERIFNPFNELSLSNYTVYMCLKLGGEYLPSDDELFNVSEADDREFNPLTKLPSILRGFLPFPIKELDIIRANPTFLDIELEGNYRHTVYETMEKKAFNALLNANSEEKNDRYYDKLLKELDVVYGKRAFQVLTADRFRKKGQMYRDLVKYEKKYIRKCVLKNKILKFARLHDAIYVNSDQLIIETKFGIVEFRVKEVEPIPKNPDLVRNFYYIDDDNNVKFTPNTVSQFLIQKGFSRIETNEDEIQLLKNTNKVVDLFNYKTELVMYLISFINEREVFICGIKNMLALKQKSILLPALSLIPSKKMKYYKDKHNTFGLAFKNGLFELTKSEKTPIQKEYKSVKGLFIKHPIQEHKFEYTEEVGMFEIFLKNSSGSVDFKAFKTMFGYMNHKFKNPASSPAIIISDVDADGITRKGGKGKSLLQKSLTYTNTFIEKGAGEFNPTYTHVFGDLSLGTSIYIIDDVLASFNYESLYTNITGAINCEIKGKKAVSIPYEDTPKFILSTNWLIPRKNDNYSTDRRFSEYKFSTHYNEKNTPLNEFGKLFFVDWDEVEWNKFYSFVFRCVREYFEFGLIKPTYNKTLDNYKIRFNNDAIFNEFERIIGKLINRPDFSVTSFLDIYNDLGNQNRHARWFTHNNTRDYIDAWCEYQAYLQSDYLFSYKKMSKKWINSNTKISKPSLIQPLNPFLDMVNLKKEPNLIN